MPLPSNCALSLLGHSRPGDTVHSKPKQAIIIRLSTEILDALEANPDAIKVEFSDSPVLWAGSAHFSMNAAKENLHHELYIRAASAAKRNAPLKLHAHVVGKFQVERQLDNDVRSRLRQSTKTLQVQRQERGIIQLEAPLVPPSKSKKATAARSAHPVVDHVTSSSRESTSSSNRSRKEPSKLVRRRMMQLLAVSDRTSDEILKALGGTECSPSDRSDLLDLLEQMAEPSMNRIDTSSKLSKNYRLKPQSWLEVRPLEWDWSSEQERSAVLIKFENALRRLSGPNTEFPAQRNGKDTLSISSATSAKSRDSVSRTTTSISRAGGALLSTKEKRQKPSRLDSDDQIGKDESRHGSKVTATQTRSKPLDVISLLPAPKASTPLRKPPGSGFRSGKASPRITSASNVDPSQRDTVDAGTKAEQSSFRKQVVTGQASQGQQSTKRSDPNRGHDRSAINNVQGFGDNLAEGNGQKRRISSRNPGAAFDDVLSNEPVLKKRKVERGGAEMDHAGSVLKESKVRDQGILERISKPASLTRPRSKGEAVRGAPTKPNTVSAFPLDNASSSRNISNKTVTSSKRRRSPIYTSSEDDAEPMDSNKDSQHVLLADHASLRKRYNSSYGEYLTAFHKLVTLRDKIDGVLRNKDGNNASDSDADLELIDPDEFGRLCSRHKRLREELESIQLLFSQVDGRDS